jgi:multifunctional 2-oxoglutarate metabolism enzyme
MIEQFLDTLVADFGNNYPFALDAFEMYQKDRASVDASWRDYFDRLTGRPREPEVSPPPPPQAVPSEPGPISGERALARRAPEALALSDAARAAAAPMILAGDIANPMRGGALRLAANMEASLLVPTATSSRTIAVRTLEENRAILNKHRAAVGESKVSLTHLVAWGVLRALDTFPRLNDAYAELEGQPHRIQRDAVRLGLAVDVQRKDGSRTLLVPNIRDAGSLSFGAFLAAVDDVVGRARKGQVVPDDFVGTTMSITNPGIVGTTLSAPRLMPGQGLIVAVGAVDYPAEYRSMAARTLSLLGISRVMTVTSTYDHRIIQGAESGLFLARIEELLKGDDGFYERLFEDIKVPHRPMRWEVDTAPGLFGPAGAREEIEKEARVLQLINAYRVRGHLVADLDPLDVKRAPHRDLDPATYGLTLWDLDREFITNGLSGKDRATLREILDVLRETYCGNIGVEYMSIQDPDRKEWLQTRMESCRNYPAVDQASRRRILDKLVEAEAFERFLHTKYIGHKRFSLEGCESLVPLLDRILSDAAQQGVREVVVGMPHRGRLNVLANVVGKSLAQIFSEFEENADLDSTHGSGDVKYHLGAAGAHRAEMGETVAVTVASNPSHLEFVDPVVEGMARAKQDAIADRERFRVVPLLIHGDAAFAGQGVVAETFNLGGLDGYRTGGTIHVVVNNQIGFTTLPEDARSSTYCTDVAKMVQAPVFHVNGDDPEAVVHVAGLALEYRQRFKRDAVIDLVGYRRWGHNEGDEPSYTQPLMYATIKGHPSVAQLYGEQLVRQGAIAREEVEALWARKKAQMQYEGEACAFAPPPKRAADVPAPVDATAMWGRLRTALRALGSTPEGFEVHPKLVPLLKKRADLLEGRGQVDWAAGEALAFGTLLIEGISIRLSGQDSGRGTFSQRHAVLFDARTGKEHVPLNELAPKPARFEVHDSLLSEAAVMGFEFGYSVASARTLVVWEAQFGDFANGAQVIIDQFLAGTETKWGQLSGLTLLLPHGHEGQGPEHSSARLERFLALCAEGNLRVGVPSTPGSLFHLLRQQGRGPVQKPLVVLTPKSLLRDPRCASPLEDLAMGRFEEVIDDVTADPARIRRVVLVTGKLYYDLARGREQARRDDVALVRIELLYPFPGAELARVLGRYASSADLVWAQEEPQNMGAWRFVRDRFLDSEVPLADRRIPRYVGRKPSASPAPGSHKIHAREQEAIVRAAVEPSTDA